MYCYPSLSVCIDIRGSLDWVCLLTGVRMWASRDPSGFVFILLHIFVSEMSDFLLGALGYCPFHHYVRNWCDFTPCLIWVDHHSLLMLFASLSSSSSSLLIHHSHFTSYSFLTTTHLGFDIPFVSPLHISLLVWFASLVSSLTLCSH